MSMITAAGHRGVGKGHAHGYSKGIMEHTVIQNLRAVKSLLRQLHHEFTTALGQVGEVREEIVNRLVREIDLGSEIEKVGTKLRADYGDGLEKVSRGVWNILIEKAEMEAYDEITMVPKEQGFVAYGVMCRWFADGFGACGASLEIDAPRPTEEGGRAG